MESLSKREQIASELLKAVIINTYSNSFWHTHTNTHFSFDVIAKREVDNVVLLTDLLIARLESNTGSDKDN